MLYQAMYNCIYVSLYLGMKHRLSAKCSKECPQLDNTNVFAMQINVEVQTKL